MRWGLPDRWNVDEQVAKTLRLIHLKSPFSVVDATHPQLYNFALAIPLSIYLAILKLINYPLETVVSAASQSWMHLSAANPGFATTVYIIARSFSVLLGLITIFLSYLIAKLLYDRKIALTSSGILAISLGLVETSHYAKSTALSLPLALLVLYLCIKGLKEENFKKFILWGSFISGLAFSAKFDGAISITFLAASFIIWLRGYKGGTVAYIKLSLSCIGLFILGVILGWPALLTNFSVYLTKKTQMGGFPHLSPSLIPFLALKIYDNIRHIIVMFGFPMALFVYAGILHFIVRFKNHSYGLLFSSMLVPYFLLNILYFTEYPGAYTKLLIQAVPIFSILAGYTIVNFLNFNGSIKALSKPVIAIVFFLTFVYVLRANMVFAHKDTRYKSTEWILKNIPKTATIEHVQEVDIVFSTKITGLYDVIFFGRSSKAYSGGSFYKLNDEVMANNYFDKLNKEGSHADYFIIAFGNEFIGDLSEMRRGVDKSFVETLFEGKSKDFKLVKRFCYPESILLTPRPSYTAPDIHIFKRIQAFN